MLGRTTKSIVVVIRMGILKFHSSVYRGKNGGNNEDIITGFFLTSIQRLYLTTFLNRSC